MKYMKIQRDTLKYINRKFKLLNPKLRRLCSRTNPNLDSQMQNNVANTDTKLIRIIIVIIVTALVIMEHL